MVNHKFYVVAGFHKKTLSTTNSTFSSLLFKNGVIISKGDAVFSFQIGIRMCRISAFLRAV